MMGDSVTSVNRNEEVVLLPFGGGYSVRPLSSSSVTCRFRMNES